MAHLDPAEPARALGEALMAASGSNGRVSAPNWRAGPWGGASALWMGWIADRQAEARAVNCNKALRSCRG